MAAVGLTGCTPGQPDPTANAPLVDGSVAETELYRQTIDERWDAVAARFPGAKRPETGIVRYVELDEYFPTLASCMTEGGFPAEAVAEGTVFGDFPAEQAEAHELRYYTCLASYPAYDRYYLPFTKDQLRRVYVYYVEEATPCLEALGYAIDPPPSEQVFVDTYYSPAGAWSPYSSAIEQADTAGEDWYDVLAVCPQTPNKLWD